MRLLLCLLLSLLACLASHLADANSYPCLPAQSAHGYKDFLRLHLPSDLPATVNRWAWTNYMRRSTKCDRSLTYFFYPTDREKVEEICAGGGRKQDAGNFCMSKQQLTFISVQSGIGTCIVESVFNITDFVVVACDLVNGICRPTQVDERGYRVPLHMFAPDCDSDEVLMMDGGPELSATAHSCALPSLLLLILCYLVA